MCSGDAKYLCIHALTIADWDAVCSGSQLLSITLCSLVVFSLLYGLGLGTELVLMAVFYTFVPSIYRRWLCILFLHPTCFFKISFQTFMLCQYIYYMINIFVQCFILVLRLADFVVYVVQLPFCFWERETGPPPLISAYIWDIKNLVKYVISRLIYHLWL